MAKIVLAKPTSGYNLAAINNNFTLIEQEFQDKALYRNNPVGEANNLETDIDANSKRIYNLPEPLLANEAARLQDVQNAISGATTANLITFTPAGTIASTNVQAAVEEVASERVVADALIRSDLAASTGSSLVGYFPDGGIDAVSVDMQRKQRQTFSVFDVMSEALQDDIKNFTYALNASAQIEVARSVATVLKKRPVFPSGGYRLDADLVLTTGTTIWGDSQINTVFKMMGTASVISSRTGGSVDYADLRDFTILQGGTASVGLDIGTLRRSVLANINVNGFLVGVNLDMGVSLVGNYWNRLNNIEVNGPGKTVANSVGFNFGNNTIPTYPDTDYNVLTGCKSFICETGIRVLNAIGCTVIGHQCTEVTRGLSLFAGNNNSIQMYVENSTNMGFADVGTLANNIDIYNDGGNATPFLDNGWNYVFNQLLGFQTLATPRKTLDCFVQDRIAVGAVGASIDIFRIRSPYVSGVATVKLACSGYTAGVQEIATVVTWSIFRLASGTPEAVLESVSGPTIGTGSFATNLMTVQSGTYAVGQIITAAGVPVGTKISSFNFGGGGVGTECVLTNTIGTLGTRPVNAALDVFTVTALANGDITWSINGHAVNLTIMNVIVDIQGIGGIQTTPYVAINGYERLV